MASRSIVTLDCETDPFQYGRYPRAFVVDIFDGEEHFTFWGADCIQRAILWLYDKRVICYAHNGGKFDYHLGFLKYIEPWARVSVIAGRVASFNLGECEYRDSLNIIPVGLGKYKKDDIDYKLMEADKRESHKDEIISYLHTDTESQYELVSAFIDTYGLHLTQAGAALKYFCKMRKLKIKDAGPAYYDKFQNFYYGGRVECFKKGFFEGDFEGFDINSAYPFAMINNHPWGFAYFELGETDPAEVEKKIDEWKSGFFEVLAISRGALPYRPASNGKQKHSLTFPCDNEPRRYFVTGWEIAAGLKTGTLTLLQVYNVILHDDKIEFSDYIYHFYDERQLAKIALEKNPTDKEALRISIFTKIFMNSLYGKFASNPDKYKEYRSGNFEDMPRLMEAGFEFAGTIGNKLLMSRKLDTEEQRFYNVATAASITGFVRAYLWENICNTVDPVYCDTDFILGKKVTVPTGAALGQWTLEGEFDQVAIAGKKLYALHKKGKGNDPKKDYKTASKGVKLGPDEIKRISLGETILYQREVPSYSYNNLPTFIERKVRMT